MSVYALYGEQVRPFPLKPFAKAFHSDNQGAGCFLMSLLLFYNVDSFVRFLFDDRIRRFCFLGIRDCLLHFCSTPPVCHFCERFRMCFACYWFMPWNTPTTERAKLHQGAKLDVRKWFGKMWTNLHWNGEFVPLHKSLRILTFINSLQKNSFF